jgi:hypothetical protein
MEVVPDETLSRRRIGAVSAAEAMDESQPRTVYVIMKINAWRCQVISSSSSGLDYQFPNRLSKHSGGFHSFASLT